MNDQPKPLIKSFPEIKLIGNKENMAFSNDKTTDLWKRFMPNRKSVSSIGSELFSIVVYPPSFFNNFNSNTEFEKWAAVKVKDFNETPKGMGTISTSGLYAVFLYVGAASEGQDFFQYIFQSWLPNSDYLLDDRPHLAIMGEKYTNVGSDSEEEICIPVKLK